MTLKKFYIKKLENEIKNNIKYCLKNKKNKKNILENIKYIATDCIWDSVPVVKKDYFHEYTGDLECLKLFNVKNLQKTDDDLLNIYNCVMDKLINHIHYNAERLYYECL